MKTKAKLTLAISVMSAAVLAAGVTSTFAWFTTQQSATVSYGNLTVSTVSSLTVSVKQIGFVADDDFSDPTSNYADNSTEMGLVSTTDGKEFVAPSTLHSVDDYTVDDLARVTDSDHWPSSNNKYVGYLKYIVHVEYLGDTVGANMNLRWKIEMQGVDIELTNVWRVGFFKASSTGFGDNIGLYSASGGTTSNTFGWNGSAVASGSYTTTTLPGDPTLLDKNATTYVNTTDGIDEFYGVSIWFEGTDAAATNALGGKKLSSLLTFDLVTGSKTHA